MSVLTANSAILCREVYHREQQQNLWSGVGVGGGGSSSWLVFQQRTSGFSCVDRKKIVSRRDLRAEAFWDTTRPVSVEMVPINDCDQLGQILLEAQQRAQPILIDWMASWCRKCIYLKPKLEKLAAEYDTKITLYCVDVNKVPQALVKRGNISKMPTIQLWKDGQMKAEVIGGHKAWMVIDEVREMIQNFI